MRIVFVIPYFCDAWAYGGQPRSAYEMARGLVARGHVVEVLTTDSGGDFRLNVPSDGFTRVVEGVTVRYYRNLSNALAFRQRVFLPLAFFRDVARQIKGADVVHIHELRSPLSVSAASAAVRQSIPFVLSPHGGLRHLGRGALKTVFDSLWGHRILRTAAAVSAVSPVEEQDALNMNVPAERIFRVPNSVPAISPETLPAAGEFRQRYKIPAGRLILFLGRLHFVKGADLLLEAFAAMNRETGESDVHLVLAGPDDGQGPQLRQMVERLNVSGRVTFTGYLGQTQKLSAFIDSSVVVVPSRSEVFAITAVEALMCARPVLLSSACGLHPMPGQEEGVHSFNVEAPDDLKMQLKNCLQTAGLFEQAKLGRAFVSREFSTDATASRLEKVYQAVSAPHA
jgi:glycosyltransferase involved in cell wall biosynthesis